MSLKGSAVAKELLKGKVNGADVIYMDTYKIAVMNGYEGTIEEWLESLKGEKGEKGEKGDPGETVDDTKVGDDPWSSNKIVDAFCPTITEIGSVVQFSSIGGAPVVIDLVSPQHQAEVMFCGKNLYDASKYRLEDGYYINRGSGAEAGAGTHADYCATREYIPVAHLRGMKINLNHTPGGTAPGMAFYDANKVKVATTAGKGDNQIVPDDASFMKFCTYINKKEEVQIELGSAASDYEHYIERSYSDVFYEFPLECAAYDGVNTVFCLEQTGDEFSESVRVEVRYKADPTALIDKLMKTVFPATTTLIEDTL